MTRGAPGLVSALDEIAALRERFWSRARLGGGASVLNIALEKAGRVADFLEFAELLVVDALTREESCGGHFREEHQSADGEAVRDDENFSHIAAWQFRGVGAAPALYREDLAFETLQPTERSYR